MYRIIGKFNVGKGNEAIYIKERGGRAFSPSLALSPTHLTSNVRYVTSGMRLVYKYRLKKHSRNIRHVLQNVTIYFKALWNWYIYIWKRGRSFDLIARTVQNKSSKSLELDRFNVKYMSWEKGKRKDESLLNCLNLILMYEFIRRAIIRTFQ